AAELRYLRVHQPGGGLWPTPLGFPVSLPVASLGTSHVTGISDPAQTAFPLSPPAPKSARRMGMKLRPVPFALGPIHFIGIGGIGMSGIAEIMLRIGYVVQGSDAKASANTERLEKLGARIFVGHDAAHVGEHVSAVVYSTAVKQDNPEMVAARERRIPLVRRA